MQSWPIPPEVAIALAVAVAFVTIVVVVLFFLRRRREPTALREEPEKIEQIEPEPAEPPPEAVAPAPAPPLPPAPPPPAPTGLRAALAKSRAVFRQRLADVFGRGRALDPLLESLEEALLSADVGIKTTSRILATVRARAAGNGNLDEERVRAVLREAITESLGDAAPKPRTAKPWVILVSGVNGVGKTTSIAKLAARFRAAGDKVLLVAADTFRAAAIDQLGVWAERVGADIVQHQSGADPAAVAFDGVKAAVARDVDVAIVDTAGRLHTRGNLMEELRKVHRVIGKAVPGAPHEVWLVLDATTGQNALHQAKVFSEALGLTGILLTKLDGTAKGGTALAVREELGVPIVFIGVGERIEDLRSFSSSEYAEALIGE
jgi:fused signal recognition particle receptor